MGPAFLLAGGMAAAVSCGGSSDGGSKVASSGGGPGRGGTGGGGGTDGGTTGGTGGGPLIDSSVGGTGGGCSTAADCDGGVCVNGLCCESAEQACGEVCCTGAELCSFGRCLQPGKPCQSAADCDDGQFCQTGIGAAADAGGPAPDAGAGCTQPVPPNGFCLDLPPICGQADAGTTCVEPCEYHPPVGKLDAVVEWQWGLDKPPSELADFADVWSTPTVARVADANCDGKVDSTDPPNVIFVSGNANSTCCSCDRVTSGTDPSTCQNGVLRVLDGRSGEEVWSLDKARPGPFGFAGLSVALGDVDGDHEIDIVAMTGDGYAAVIGRDGQVKAVSDQPAEEFVNAGGVPPSLGWGGGVALGDMDNDGSPEIAYGTSVFSTGGPTLTRLWTGARGGGGGAARALSFFVDLDGNGTEELLAGNMAYDAQGNDFWAVAPPGVPNGYNAVADFDEDGDAEVVVIARILEPGPDCASGTARSLLWLLHADGTIWIGPVELASEATRCNASNVAVSSLNGGPPTIADFDGDGLPEIGVALRQEYVMVEPNLAGSTADVVWRAPNHDLSSSVTGSSVFDFQGDGSAEVVYNDECFLWVYDGKTGSVLFATQTTSFTATEASIVADVDGDGHSEIVMISNGANPTVDGWACDVDPWNQPDPSMNRPAWKPPAGGQPAYRGITVFGDRQSSWVGTRTLWNQHAYSVSNVCDDRDSACDAPNVYGRIPDVAKRNWTVPWLNNFRQNVQDEGIFDAPDAVVSLAVACTGGVSLLVTVENVGLAGLPAGIEVGIFVETGGTETQIGSVTTTIPLLPGQSEKLPFTATGGAGAGDEYLARILIDPANKTFNECRDDNNESAKVKASCGPR